MSFALTSHMSLQAATSQYLIDSDASVRLTLYGSQSYCYLKAIQDPKLKESLAKVGNAFEMKALCRFFNVNHTFTPTEATDNNNSDAQVKDIFAFAKTAIAEQTDGSLVLELADVTRLVVQKAEDRSFLEPNRAYELEITISEKAVEATEKSGLVFRKYGLPLPFEGRAYALGVGQRTPFY